MTGCDVLAVFAHPDDESLLAGGTMAACAAAGLDVGIVSMTRGELGGASGEVRTCELSDAASVLGAAWAQCLDYPDGQLGSVERAESDAALRALSDGQPDAVLTFSAEGLYWHPDHVAVHEIVRSAFPEKSVYELSWPEGLLACIVEEMRRRGLASDVWGLDPRAFGVPADTIEHELDVSSFLEVKLRALRCHSSQLLTGHALTELPDDLALELLGREWFVSCPDDAWLERVVAEGRAVGRNA